MELAQRVPAGLWENLQDLTAQLDNVFLRDVAHIAKIPFETLRKLFPTRGIVTKIATDGNVPWWHDHQCRIITNNNGIWTRCTAGSFEGPDCVQHRNKKLNENLRLYDDPYISTLPTRVPWRLEGGAVVWTDEAGSVYSLSGERIEDYTICSTHGWLIEKK
jgi:hypothetical protein